MQNRSDAIVEELKKENDSLKSQNENLNNQLMSKHDQDADIMLTVEKKVKEFRVS